MLEQRFILQKLNQEGISMIKLNGGDGSTREKSILILGAKSDLEGVEVEYKYLEMLYGEQNAEWQFSE